MPATADQIANALDKLLERRGFVLIYESSEGISTVLTNVDKHTAHGQLIQAAENYKPNAKSTESGTLER